MFIYENIGGAKLDDLAAQFDQSYKIKDYDSSIPESGIFMGSICGANWIRENRPKIKLWANFKNFRCSTYYPKLGNLLFNDRYVLVPFQELPRLKWTILPWLGKECMVFIRPNSGEKDIPAQLVDIQDIDKHVESFDFDGLVLVTTPKNMIGEWRFVVSDKIEAVSSYQYQGLLTQIPNAPLGAYDLVNEVLSLGWKPDEIFCIDVVQAEDYRFYVMELTSFSSAGLYACDIHNIAQLLKTKIKPT